MKIIKIKESTRFKVLFPQRFNDIYCGHEVGDRIVITEVDKEGMIEYLCRGNLYYTSINHVRESVKHGFIVKIK